MLAHVAGANQIETYALYPVHHFDSPGHRGATDMALQRCLGILPQRRFGSHFVDCAADRFATLEIGASGAPGLVARSQRTYSVLVSVTPCCIYLAPTAQHSTGAWGNAPGSGRPETLALKARFTARTASISRPIP